MTKRLLLSALLLCGSLARAVPVEKWVQTSQSDFEKGQAKGISLLTLGQVALAPDLKPLLAEPVPHIWALAVDAKGAVHAATGTEPKLLRLRGGKVETVFTSPVKTDLEILAVAVGPDGALYASSAPSGTLFRIGPDGKAEALYKGDAPYLWSLAVAADGMVYATTGPDGKLLKITPKGKATPLLSAGSRHLLSLLLAPDGSLYAGSDRDGLLYHVSPKGEARLVYDAEEPDIRAMAMDPRGRLLFATAGTGRTSAPTMPPTPAPAPTPGRAFTLSGRDASDGAGGPSALSQMTTHSVSGGPATARARTTAGNSVYRLMPTGDVVRVVRVAGAGFYSLLYHGDKLYAGTGNDGKLYCIEGSRIVRLANLDESQITALALAEGRVLAATANSGRVYELAAEHAATGTFVSQVHDSQTHSRWGVITWEARVPSGARLTVATRSGNAATPDETWSPWSSELSRAEGDHIPSPPARFLQFRLTLKANRAGQSPVLDEVVVSYAQSNRRPLVAQVQIQKPPKPPKPRRPTTTAQPRLFTMPQPSTPLMAASAAKQPPSPRGPFADTVRISWQASDPNKDDLVYSVYFRGEGETAWKKLEDRLDAVFYDWDTHAVPDGPFRIRVVASDSPTNPPDQALAGEKITEAFLVDNTPPTVAGLAVRVAKDRSLTVTAKCSDAGSGLGEGEYCIDGGDWVSIASVDGIFDGQGEALDFKVPALPKGEHTLVVRVRDQAENSGAAKSVLIIQ